LKKEVPTSKANRSFVASSPAACGSSGDEPRRRASARSDGLDEVVDRHTGLLVSGVGVRLVADGLDELEPVGLSVDHEDLVGAAPTSPP